MNNFQQFISSALALCPICPTSCMPSIETEHKKQSPYKPETKHDFGWIFLLKSVYKIPT